MTKSGRLAWAAVALVLVGAAFVRWRYAGVALERDEGEYAYAGQLILQGIPPYQLAYNMKFPGTYYAYSLVLGVLGQTPWAIRIGLLVINALTTGLVFLIARRLVGLGGAVTAAIVFVILSLDRNVLGVFAHATHFVLLPALAGLYLLLDQSRAERPLRLAAAGVLLGIAVIMKQPGAFFLALGGVVVLVREWQRRPREIRVSSRRMLAFCGGAVAPMLLLGLVLAWQGVFGRFWFWTIDYARAYVGETPTAAAWDGLRLGWLLTTEVTRAFWFLGAVGALLLFVTRWSATTRTWIAAFAVVSFLAVCPGFYFRRHYFVLALPAVAILTGVATQSIANLAAAAGQVRAGIAAAVLVMAGLVGLYVVTERSYLFTMTPAELSRHVYPTNPFLEAEPIAQYIAAHTEPSDPIAVVGSEPEILFYAKRHSATGYVYTYALMEPQPFAARMQDEYIHEIEAVHPKYLVASLVSTSWLVRTTSDLGVLDWVDIYTKTCYDLVGVAEVSLRVEPVLRWDAAAATYSPRDADVVYTFRRKSDAPCAVR